MALVAFAPFGGLIPRSDPLALPSGAAQKATSCRLTGGVLEAYKAPLQVYDPAPVGFSGELKSIYRYGQTDSSDTTHWFVSSSVRNYVKGAIAGDSEERTYWTDGVSPRVTKSTIATSSTSVMPAVSYRNGIVAPGEPPVASLPTGSYDLTALTETRYYVCTFVTTLGEESPPSPLSNEVSLHVGQVVPLLLPAIPTVESVVTSRRIYRTSTGSSATEFLFVAEVPVVGGSSSAVYYEDAVPSDQLSEPCPTIDSAVLPSNARGLVELPNGIMAAHTTYDVYFSETYKQYSYPEGYVQTVSFPIIGQGVFGNTLVVLTSGVPYLMTGTDPTSVSVEKLSEPYSCLSPQSIVSAMNSVLYAAPDGLISISTSGAKVLTESVFTRREWNELNPTSMVCAVWDEKIFVFYTGASSTRGLPSYGGLIIDLNGGMAYTPYYATAAFTDPVTNSLFLAVNNKIVKWDAGSAAAFDWKSRVLIHPMPSNFAWGQVLADTYPVTVTVTADNSTMTYSATSDAPFRMQAGFKARYWTMELSGSGKVFNAYIASSMDELKNV